MTTLLIFLALSVGFGTALVMTTLLYSALRYAPYVPTKKKVARQMVAIAELRDGQKIYDLGCGDGRLLREAMKVKDVQATGFEVSRVILWWAQLKGLFSKAKPRLICANFFQEDISDADVVFCYLFPKIMLQLQQTFEKQLKPGAKVISHSFPITAWKPTKTIQTRADKPHNFLIYLYSIPESLPDAITSSQ